MSEHDVLKKNRNFYIGVGGTVLEGLLSGSLFMLLYSVMQFLWSGQFDMNRVLVLTCVIAVVFLLRILIYSYGYTKAQIGGAEVSKNTRLFMGDHLKRIPLSRFTQGQTGDYINTITSDVNNYEKILTHKIGDMAKSFALSLMLIIFVMTIYVPAGIILLIADLLLIPGLWLSFRMVRKYGKEKNDICAENVSSIVEYVSGIQTFRAYGVGGLKNKTVINAMREFCRISFVYEAKVLPIGAGFGILSWLSCPLVIWTAYAPWAAGTLDTVSYLLICMLPLFCAKLANSIFVDLTSYKNLMISKNKILGVMNEPEETGSMEPLQTATHEITFDSVDFSYVPGEPVLKHATFTVPDQKLPVNMGGGVILKYNARQTYTTSGLTGAAFTAICEKAGVPVQTFANRADVAGGSTLGNLLGRQILMPMVDIGVGQLAMHSAMETASCKDAEYLANACAAYYNTPIFQPEDGQWKLGL